MRSIPRVSHVGLITVQYEHRQRQAFTLVELMVSAALLTILLLILTTVTDSTSRAWRNGQRQIDTFQSARTSLEILARELTPAVVDTRMQFVSGPASILTDVGAPHVTPTAPVLLWMAPLGTNGDLRCVGYYLYRDEAKKFYRLKRIFVGAGERDDPQSRYFPRMVNLTDPRDPTLRTSPVNANWFVRNWDKDAFDEENPHNDKAIVSTAADGVVALWVQCLDSLGNPVPLLSKAKYHPQSDLFYNSAAFMQMATTRPFENNRSVVYLAETPETMKANRVPAAIDLTVVTLDARTIERTSNIPMQASVIDVNSALDVDASARAYEEALRQQGIFTSRTFTTRVKLISGS